MTPFNNFYSKLDQLKKSQAPSILALSNADKEQLINNFTSLLSPILGKNAAADLCNVLLQRLELSSLEALDTFGNTAAFFLEILDYPSLLESEDWRDIQETLEEVSGDIDIDILTRLMGQLLSFNKIEPIRKSSLHS
ncbi:hypothetical protein ACYULU_06750 [Breznakiellaceae bacterium SP9]